MLAVQADLSPVTRDADNTFHRSRYATLGAMLAAVMPVLTRHGLVLLQPLDHVGDLPAVRTILIHVDSGESIDCVHPIEKAGMKGANVSQQFGAAISYVRRYGLAALLCLREADDDAQCVGKQAAAPASVPAPTSWAAPAPAPAAQPATQQWGAPQ
jgi:hypothetical protein